MKDATVAELLRALTDDAARRWGPERATALAEALASTAETLALVAAASFELGEAEPDSGIPPLAFRTRS